MLFKYNILTVGFLRLLIISVIFGVWEVISAVTPNMTFFIGSPSLIIASLSSMLAGMEIYIDIIATGGAAVTGLFVGTVAGSALGLSLWYSPYLARVVQPFVVGLGAFPILSLAPLMILWFGVDIIMKIAMAVFSTFFVAFAQAFRGAHSVDEEFLDFMKGMGAKQRQIFFKVIVPGSLGWVLNSMRINIGLALLGAFIGEFIASDVGLGHKILRSSSLYDVPKAIATSFIVVIVGLIFDLVGRMIEHHRLAIMSALSVPVCHRKVVHTNFESPS